MADPVTREQFDADQATELQATTDYITAVDAFINTPQVIDLATEDAAVKTALDAVNAARSRVPTAPPPPPKPQP